jgi:hypothetical protein
VEVVPAVGSVPVGA